MQNLFILGDSISVHYTPFVRQALPGRRVQRKGDFEALLVPGEPDAANGGDSGMALAYLQDVGDRLRFDCLLLNCGLHDIKIDPTSGRHQVEVQEYRRNLEAILALARQMAQHVVWVATTPVDDERHRRLNASFTRLDADVQRYNAAAGEVMRPAGVPQIDLYTFTRNLGPDVYVDHVHFSEQVSARQAALIAGFLLGWMEH